MTSKEAYKTIDKYYHTDNITENDDFVFVEACKFLIETENDASVMSMLGGYYYGKEKYSLAEKYYLMAHQNGDDYASDGLGFIYYYGRTGERDYQKAFYYFSISKDLGNDEAAMKIADMYHNGYGVEKDDTKYREILEELYEKVKNDDNLFCPYPEIAHRLADIYINEGNEFEAISLLIRGKSFITQRIRYNPFWGNFIVCRRTIQLLYKVIELNPGEIDFFDLFYILNVPKEVKLIYNGKTYKISSYFDENQIRVQCGENHYKSIEDFLIKATFDNKHTYVIHYEDYYKIKLG